MSDAKSIIHENMPPDGDGCSIRSWRCERPNKQDMENGRTDGTTPEEVKNECKRCPVCMMIRCEYHMTEKSHMIDCNYRSNQERQLLEEQRAEEVAKRVLELEDKNRLARVKAELDEKEKNRREAIEERNRKVREGK